MGDKIDVPFRKSQGRLALEIEGNDSGMNNERCVIRSGERALLRTKVEELRDLHYMIGRALHYIDAGAL